MNWWGGTPFSLSQDPSDSIKENKNSQVVEIHEGRQMAAHGPNRQKMELDPAAGIQDSGLLCHSREQI